MSEKRLSAAPPSPGGMRPPQRRGASFLSPRHVEEKAAPPAESPGLDNALLPPPAVAFVPPGTSNKLKVRWQKLKRRVGNGSAPSESLGDPTNTTGSDAGSSFVGNRRNALNSTAGADNTSEDADIVDEVVVDQSDEYDCWKRTTIPSQSASHPNGTGTAGGTGQIGTMPSDGSSIRQTAYETNGPVDAVIGFARYRVWPYLTRFFMVRCPRFGIVGDVQLTSLGSPPADLSRPGSRGRLPEGGAFRGPSLPSRVEPSRRLTSTACSVGSTARARTSLVQRTSRSTGS